MENSSPARSDFLTHREGQVTVSHTEKKKRGDGGQREGHCSRQGASVAQIVGRGWNWANGPHTRRQAGLLSEEQNQAKLANLHSFY